jgi:hypothetical protein
MNDAPGPASVSVSRPQGSETARHPAFRRDSTETAGETPGLKALARLVLTRDSRRDTERCRASRLPCPIGTSAETVTVGETAPAAWGETEEERAAIIEHDGAIPRTWAEGFARLHPDRPPGDVPAKRWLQFVDDVGRFLDSPFCAVAITLGWDAYDLFGADRDRPYARIDRVGLLWLLNGDKLVALTDATATIETRTGRRQTYRRKPNDPGRVLAWELAELGCPRTTSLMQETD